MLNSLCDSIHVVVIDTASKLVYVPTVLTDPAIAHFRK